MSDLELPDVGDIETGSPKNIGPIPVVAIYAAVFWSLAITVNYVAATNVAVGALVVAGSVVNVQSSVNVNVY